MEIFHEKLVWKPLMRILAYKLSYVIILRMSANI